MKRHPALIPFSHDHHHALVEARRLRDAADRDDDPEAVAAAFADFFTAVSVPHFREEEERLFPLVADSDEARPLVAEALLDHQRLHALVAELQRSSDVRASMREIGVLLEAHVRREERELFPLIERLAAGRLELAGRPAARSGVRHLTTSTPRCSPGLPATDLPARQRRARRTGLPSRRLSDGNG